MPGSDNVIELEVAQPEAMRELFATLHRKRFGYSEKGGGLVVDSSR